MRDFSRYALAVPAKTSTGKCGSTLDYNTAGFWRFLALTDARKAIPAMSATKTDFRYLHDDFLGMEGVPNQATPIYRNLDQLLRDEFGSGLR